MSFLQTNYSTITDQSAFNTLLRTVVELPEDGQKKIQESLERTGRHYAPILEDAAKVCRENANNFPERIVPTVNHGYTAYRNDAQSIRQKYENVVLTATKLHSAIVSSQAEARIITRVLDDVPESQSRPVIETCKKVINEGNRMKESMLKHIKEILPHDNTGARGVGGRAPKTANYARPGGGPVLPDGGLGLIHASSRRSLGGGERKNKNRAIPKKN